MALDALREELAKPLVPRGSTAAADDADNADRIRAGWDEDEIRRHQEARDQAMAGGFGTLGTMDPHTQQVTPA